MRTAVSSTRLGHLAAGLAGGGAGAAAVWLITGLPGLPDRWRWGVLAAVVSVAVIALLAAVLGPGARWLAGVPALSRKERAGLDAVARIEAMNSARSALLQSATGFAVLLGLVFTAASVATTSRTLDTTQQGQITDRYTRSVEQLGSKAPEVRLGGIFALERIAGDSPRDRTAITQVLASYLRVHAQDPPPPGQDRTRLAVDVSAALSVLGRRDLAAEQRAGFRVDLSQLDFHGKNLRWADLRRVNLRGADLSKTDLSNAHLGAALAGGAQLDGALLRCANLNLTGLVRARLVKADLRYADLRGAALDDADLDGALVSDGQLAQARTRRAIGRPLPAPPADRSELCTS